MVSPDGEVVACMRVSAGSFSSRETRAGTCYLHRLGGGETYPRSLRIPTQQRSTTPRVIAPVEYRHFVYTYFLDSLTLSSEHAAELRDRRGLSEETVTRNLYATVPPPELFAAAIGDLASRFDLSAIPGFYLTESGWQCIARRGELLIPVRDEFERIEALLRGTGGEPKYVWMSDASRGVSCGAPLHFALPYLGDLYPESPIVVTEGVLKADSIAESLHFAVVGCPGTVIPDDIGERVRTRFPSATGVTIAFDSDVESNPRVRSAVVRLIETFETSGLTSEVLRWDGSRGKGLDDVLLRRAS